MSDDRAPRLTVADRWPVLHNWAHGGTVGAPELIAECRDLIRYWGGSDEGAVAAYLDHLLGELPEEAVEAAADEIRSLVGPAGTTYTDHILRIFIRSLRAGLKGER